MLRMQFQGPTNVITVILTQIMCTHNLQIGNLYQSAFYLF